MVGIEDFISYFWKKLQRYPKDESTIKKTAAWCMKQPDFTDLIKPAPGEAKPVTPEPEPEPEPDPQGQAAQPQGPEPEPWDDEPEYETPPTEEPETEVHDSEWTCNTCKHICQLTELKSRKSQRKSADGTHRIIHYCPKCLVEAKI